eukprot:1142538-Pelagomonas_calceolata.AAC.1
MNTHCTHPGHMSTAFTQIPRYTKATLTKGTRARLAKAPTRAVLPTPGDPSTSTALRSCSARSSRNALRAVVGADSSNCVAVGVAASSPC